MKRKTTCNIMWVVSAAMETVRQNQMELLEMKKKLIEIMNAFEVS